MWAYLMISSFPSACPQRLQLTMKHFTSVLYLDMNFIRGIDHQMIKLKSRSVLGFHSRMKFPRVTAVRDHTDIIDGKLWSQYVKKHDRRQLARQLQVRENSSFESWENNMKYVLTIFFPPDKSYKAHTHTHTILQILRIRLSFAIEFRKPWEKIFTQRKGHNNSKSG